MTIKITPKTKFTNDWISEWTYYDLELKRISEKVSKHDTPFDLIGYLMKGTGFTIAPEHDYDRIWQGYLLGFLNAMDIEIHDFQDSIEEVLRKHDKPEDIRNARLIVKLYDGKYEIEKEA